MSTQRKRGDAKKVARCYKGRWRHLNTMACLAAADNSPPITQIESRSSYQWTTFNAMIIGLEVHFCARTHGKTSKTQSQLEPC